MNAQAPIPALQDPRLNRPEPFTPRDGGFAWPFLAGLGRKSLGSILLADAGIQRGELRHALLPAAHPLARRARRSGAWPGGEGGAIHARRRLFRRGPGLLLVTELFLPAVLALKPSAERSQEQSGIRQD